MTRAVLTLLALGCASRLPAADPREVFERRIVPILKSPNPSSCVQCHLAGVDLKDYLRPTHEETFASLRDQGLIDLAAPEKSKILALIRMGGDASASTVPATTRKVELDAFSAWVTASAADPALRNVPKLPPAGLAKPKRPDAVIRHARTDRLLESFEQTVWATRFRCMNCHTEGTPQNKKLVEEHGERVAWVKAAGPDATLTYLRSSKLIDPETPENSLLLKKPLNAVKHGGGQKFTPGDQGDAAYRQFLTDYARVVKDQYPDAASLPSPDAGPRQFGTDIWLKLTNTPPAWADRLVQADVYAWDAAANGWEMAPVATSDRVVWGKGKVWQHNLTLLAATGSDRAKAWKAGPPTLPKGRYQVRVSFPGRPGELGRVVVESAWPAGYGKMTVADAGKAIP